MTVLLLGVVATVSLYSLIRPRNVDLEDAAQTERALAQAREALIAYASGQTTSNRAGELPCPDVTNTGQAGSPNCNTLARQIGRLPWLTLGIPDLRDGSGERLWYAVSNNFKKATAVTPLNSNTLGQLTVTGIAPASNVIAIVFAPGQVTGAQQRDTTLTFCAMTGTTIKRELCPTNYLEGENANGDTIFTTAASSGTFNDRLLAITPSKFFPAVEMSVARTMRATLNLYFSNNLYFPPANAYSVAGCTVANQGMLPADTSVCGGAASWPAGLPTWFGPNQWYRILFYAVAPACMGTSTSNCNGTGGLLTVNGAGGIRAAIISPGAPYSGQTRPCAAITDCLETPNTSSFPAYTHATGSTTINDRVVIVSP